MMIKHLKESKFSDYAQIYFHGSKSNQKILSLNPPSPQNIFFVTSDIDYASHYAFNDNSGKNSNIYVLLMDDHAKIFNAQNYSDYRDFDIWPNSVKDLFSIHNHFKDPLDIFNLLLEIVDFYSTMKKFNFNWNNFFWKYYHDGFLEYDAKEEYMRKFEALKFFMNRFPGIFETGNRYEVGEKLRAIFCEDLKSKGFSAFLTEEVVRNKSKGHIRSNKCFGVFDVSAFKSIYPIPLDETIVKQAEKVLRSDMDDYGYGGKNYKNSNEIVMKFIEIYQKLDK